MSTLGQRNNNPLNIRFDKSNKWIGQTGSYRGFCVFDKIDYGFRAAMLLIQRYVRVYNHRSVRDIISRFAPVSENETDKYIRYVQSCLQHNGFDYDFIVPFSDSFYYMIRFMSMFESHIDVDVDSLRKLAAHFHLN